MKSVILTNTGPDDATLIELIPASGAKFILPTSTFVVGNNSIKACLNSAAPKADPVVTQDGNTWELILESEPNAQLRIYSPMLDEEIGIYDLDETGRHVIDTNSEFNWWVPDASILEITRLDKPQPTVEFKIRVRTEGWVEKYYPISRRIALSTMPESTYELYNNRTGELTNSGTVTNPYSDPYTLPVTFIDIDQTKYSGGDVIRVVNKVMVGDVEHSVDFYLDTNATFVEFTDDQVTEMAFDNVYKSTVWNGPFMQINNPYVKAHFELIDDSADFYIIHEEAAIEKPERVELSFRPRKTMTDGQVIRFKMVIAQNHISIPNVDVQAQLWWLGMPVIGSQIVNFIGSDSTSINKFMSDVRFIPTTIPPTLKDVSFWFFNYNGGSPDIWNIINNWDMSNVNIFHRMFAYSTLNPGFDPSNWGIRLDADRTEMYLNSNVSF